MKLGETIQIIVTTGGLAERVQATVTRMSGTECVYVTPTEGSYDGHEFRLGQGCRLVKQEARK